MVRPLDAEAANIFADGLDGTQKLALLDGEGANREVDGRAFCEQEKRFEQGNGILAAGYGYGNAVAVANHAEAMNGFADFPQQSFFEVHQTRLTREVRLYVFEAGVHHLFKTIEFGSKHLAVLVKTLIQLSA